MSDSFSRFQAQQRFASLDGLRAFSILGVIWHHTAASVHGPFLGHVGAEGVSLFFAISGFLITTLLLREQRRQGQVDLKAFYVRRSLRIFPLYYATLALYVLTVWVLERHSAVGRAFLRICPTLPPTPAICLSRSRGGSSSTLPGPWPPRSSST